MFAMQPSARLRTTPYNEATLAEGAVKVMVYNNVILPTGYGHPEEEYWRIINGVSQWDVACERQVQLKGPDAGRLAQILCPRDLSTCEVGQGKYVPLCNHAGMVINDPILLKLADDLYWLSIADSDIWMWARSIAHERGLDVEISEPDVSPMAVQGPLAETVVASLFGDWVCDLRYFRFKETSLEGIPVLLMRSGWSKQGGFEIFLKDGSQGTKLWNIVKEAGKPFGIGPGAPATAERTESGLVSVGGDTDEATSPFEVRLGKYVDLQVADDVIGIQALRQIADEGPKRHQLGLILEGDTPAPLGYAWEEIRCDGRKVGDMTNCMWSYRMKSNLGYALISREMQSGATVEIIRSHGPVTAQLVDLPFL